MVNRIDVLAAEIHAGNRTKGFYDESPERDDIDYALAAILHAGIVRHCEVVEKIRKTGIVPPYIREMADKMPIALGSNEAKVAARVMLIVTEAAECDEALQQHAVDGRACNIGEELADISIRTFCAGQFCADLGMAKSHGTSIEEKMATNVKRSHKHGGKHA